jgi:hypothetical protein
MYLTPVFANRTQYLTEAFLYFFLTSGVVHSGYGKADKN